MTDSIFIDGKRAQSVLSTRSLFYGEGIFETFRYKASLPVLLNRHLERMKEGADLLKIPFPGKECLIALLEKAILESEIRDAYVKVCLLSEGESAFYSVSKKSQVFVIIREYLKPSQSQELKVNSYRRISESPLVRIKSTNYLENMLARREALNFGFDEALFLNEEDQIAECAASNLFWFKGETLFTPSEACGLLVGTTRNLVLTSMANSDIHISEGKFTLNDLIDADFVFTTNSLTGCVPVSKIEGDSFDTNNPLFLGIQSAVLTELKWI